MPEPRGRAGGLALYRQRGSAYMAELGRRGAAAKKQMAIANIMAELAILAGQMAQRARDNVLSLPIPKDIANAISVGEPKIKGDGRIVVEVKVDLGDPAALGSARQGRAAARAFEYGSGVHSTHPGDSTDTYPIEPREKPALAFPFIFTGPASSSKLIGGVVDGDYMHYDMLIRHILESDDGAVLADPSFWKHVDHPGVEPQPYLRPALESIKPELKSRLGKAFANSFIEESFVYTVEVS